MEPETGELLDAALVLYFAAPASETGEDIAELQVHGSPAVITGVLAALGRLPGCRPAEPGEFARRAFLNGKIDLTAAEGLADLIDAETDAQRRQALAQAGGAFARLCDGWRQRLLEARALAESAIDFADEEDVFTDALERSRALARPLVAEIGEAIAGAHRGEIVREGFTVVLAGAPNAGKSSLLNLLARRDVAIVSSEPGTTRDVLEVHLDLDGYAVIVSDTAGLRSHGGDVEREGMRRARARAQGADLVLWLMAADDPELPPPDLVPDPSKRLVVLNKIDLIDRLDQVRAPSEATDPVPAPGQAQTDLFISARTGEGVAALVSRLTAAVASRLSDRATSALPTRERHRLALAMCLEALSRSLAPHQSQPEFIAEDLRLASDALGRITGRIDAEEVLGEIFGRFCIGK